MQTHRPVALIIRDGWGLSPQGETAKDAEGNAPLLARLPYQDKLYAQYPHATLSASGEDVGLPDGQMGNSEVGHLNLGAGRIVYQDFLRINNTIKDGKLAAIPALQELFAHVNNKGDALHFWGLLSDGGVHSHQQHLYALLRAAKDAGVATAYIHCFMDGRDTSPHGGKQYLAELEAEIEAIGLGTIATMIGRYYAMDRDQRWERTKLAYDLVFRGVAEKEAFGRKPSEVIQEWYAEDKTDEFIPATVFAETPRPLIADGDGILFYNFRSDRGRQLCRAATEEQWEGWDRGPAPKVEIVTMTRYHEDFRFPLLFGPQSMDDILGKVVSAAGKRQLRCAETEKYPHVTFFFNGGEEEPFPGEDRLLVNSPKVATYDLQPEMSAPELTEKVLAKLGTDDYDLLILNFANPDMVGHTGVLAAAVKAVETVDGCLKQVVDKILELGGCALICADHGNCERMVQDDGSAHTAHTTNLVQIWYVGNDAGEATISDGILADVSPTLLKLMGLAQPKEMTGTPMVSFEDE
ncbi:MAG: 2,3-bisphosphoglycerate-independent phosphoglycerate mutase [Verrucomicrobiota bacterium]